MSDAPQPKRLCAELRQYSCDACAATFKQRGALNRHVRSVHVQVRYPCAICGKKFTERGKCINHMLETHPREEVIHECRYPNCGMLSYSKAAIDEHVKEWHEIA